MPELADVVSTVTGQTVTYSDLSVQDYQAFLVRAGLPEPAADSIADLDRAVAAGELYVDTGHREAAWAASYAAPDGRKRRRARSQMYASTTPDESGRKVGSNQKDMQQDLQPMIN
jgi:hypothetical protein